jgi:hypothetical protein
MTTPGKVKVTIYITEEAQRRLYLHALIVRGTISAAVEGLILDNIPDYKVEARKPGGNGPASPGVRKARPR